MSKVKLDLTKLLGFSILAQEGDRGTEADKLGARIGEKTGIKEGNKTVILKQC